jgi:transporter family protein
MQLPTSLLVGWLALAGRVVGLGLERPLVKALGQGRNSFAATTVYFGLGELMLLPFIAWQMLATPGYLADVDGWIIPALVTAVIYAVSFHAYVWAMGVGEVSFLAPLFGTSFVFLYVLDFSFGAAQFTWLASLGILAVTLGVVFLNIAPQPAPGVKSARGAAPARRGACWSPLALPPDGW